MASIAAREAAATAPSRSADNALGGHVLQVGLVDLGGQADDPIGRIQARTRQIRARQCGDGPAC